MIRKGDTRAIEQGPISCASATYLLDFTFDINNNSFSKANNYSDVVEINSPEFGFTNAPYEENLKKMKKSHVF